MEEDGTWRTVGGKRIFIKDGQDLATVMRDSGKFGNKKYDYNNFSKSKVTKTIYHASPEDIKSFKEDYEALEDNEGSGAIWFSDKKDYTEQILEVKTGSGYVYETKINIQNPMEVALPRGEFANDTVEAKYIKEAKAKGNDSVIFTRKGVQEEREQDTFYAVFSTEQIKIEKKEKYK